MLSPFVNDALEGYDELEQHWQSVQDNDELMRGDGEEGYDSECTTGPFPLNSVAGVLHPSDSSRAYVFCGDKYVTIKVIPGTMGDTTARFSSRVIVFDWPSLSMFAGWIDAVLPIPNTKQMYFFAGDSYALINADPGS